MTWNEHVAAWSHPPIDGVGYIASSELMKLSDDQLRKMIDDMRVTRYQGERNFENRWRDIMGLDLIQNKDVLDFGCGVGIESVELALAGNTVSIADISMDSLKLAFRVIGLYGHTVKHAHLVTDEAPFTNVKDNSIDVFHCNGVLHHCRWPNAIMYRAWRMLRTDGVARLMLYSDFGWGVATGTAPPSGPTSEDPNFMTFVRFFDAVGDYADWYDRKKIEAMFGDLFTIERFRYLTPDNRYLGVELRKKD